MPVCRSGPRKTIYHNPKDVVAAIVTCEWQVACWAAGRLVWAIRCHSCCHCWAQHCCCLLLPRLVVLPPVETVRGVKFLSSNQPASRICTAS